MLLKAHNPHRLPPTLHTQMSTTIKRPHPCTCTHAQKQCKAEVLLPDHHINPHKHTDNDMMW